MKKLKNERLKNNSLLLFKIKLHTVSDFFSLSAVRLAGERPVQVLRNSALGDPGEKVQLGFYRKLREQCGLTASSGTF